MSPEKRTELIRKGNLLFNSGDIETAALVFKATNYKDGLIRVGDYFYFEKHQPLRAYGYYRQAGHEKGTNKIAAGFVFALKCWLWGEVKEEKWVHPSDFKETAVQSKPAPEKKVHLKPPVLGKDYMTPPPKKKNS